MALIRCPECGNAISDKSEKCIHCGYPIGNQSLQGKVVFQTTGDFIGLAGKYIIKDHNGNTLAKLKASDRFAISINADTMFYIRYSGGFATFKEVFAPDGRNSVFEIGLSKGGAGFYVDKIG